MLDLLLLCALCTILTREIILHVFLRSSCTWHDFPRIFLVVIRKDLRTAPRFVSGCTLIFGLYFPSKTDETVSYPLIKPPPRVPLDLGIKNKKDGIFHVITYGDIALDK